MFLSDKKIIIILLKSVWKAYFYKAYWEWNLHFCMECAEIIETNADENEIQEDVKMNKLTATVKY